MPINLRPATEADFPAIITLMNTAFRGKEGWSIEGEYITGERTSISLLNEEISPKAPAISLRTTPPRPLSKAA